MDLQEISCRSFVLITILGAGGSISNELARVLAAKSTPFRLVSRDPKPLPGATLFRADLSDRQQTIDAVAGSSVVCLLAGLKYDLGVWREFWPRIMANAIEACQRAQAKLLFFDNVYMYGRVRGPMIENTPYAPCSKKGEVRAKIATQLMDAVKAGNLTAMIARSADFYGPNPQNAVPNILVLDAFAKGKKASWLVNDGVPHSLTFTPDAARGVAMLIERKSAWNQIWHLPTAPNPLTGKQFITMAAQEFGIPARYRVLNRPMLWLAGRFNPLIGELYEMLYQNDSPYLFDSAKFATTFSFAGTPYAEGIRISANAYPAKKP